MHIAATNLHAQPMLALLRLPVRLLACLLISVLAHFLLLAILKSMVPAPRLTGIEQGNDYASLHINLIAQKPVAAMPLVKQQASSSPSSAALPDQASASYPTITSVASSATDQQVKSTETTLSSTSLTPTFADPTPISSAANNRHNIETMVSALELTEQQDRHDSLSAKNSLASDISKSATGTRAMQTNSANTSVISNSQTTAKLIPPPVTAISVTASWQAALDEIHNALSHHMEYPLRARRRGWEGEVLLSFNLSQHGRIDNVQIQRSSGYSLLDNSALSAMQKLRAISWRGTADFTALEIPVLFRLHNG